MTPPIRLHAVEDHDLPRLAWLVRAGAGRRVVEVRHGPWVEVGAGFAVEGAWTGAFEDGGFHRCATFFGSGVRVEGDGLWLVPSRMLVDRILFAVHDGTLIAANSLPLLLAATGARLDPDANYRVPTSAPLQGIDAYPDEIPVVHPRLPHVRQRLYDPLIWQRGATSPGPRPAAPGFSDYADYVEAMRREVGKLVVNARSTRRSRPMSVMSTISKGYDSPAVTALAADHGLDLCFAAEAPLHSLLDGLGGILAPDDSGEKIGRRLGVPVEAPGVYRALPPEQEPFFYAAGAMTTELALAWLCVRVGRGDAPALLLTGYHGDLVWDVDLEARFRTPKLKSGGCDISEIRLASGFVNAPVPGVHARAVGDLYRISSSQAMTAWRLGTEYDRPIPRRILEQAGVPREAFGRTKRVVERRERWPRAPGLRRDFADHLRARHGWPPPLARVMAWGNDLARSLSGSVARTAGSLGLEVSAKTAREALGYVDLEHELHVWAVNRLADRFADRAGPEVSGG